MVMFKFYTLVFRHQIEPQKALQSKASIAAPVKRDVGRGLEPEGQSA
jgi:hypothetical protein